MSQKTTKQSTIFCRTKFVMIWNELVIKLLTEETFFFQFSCSSKNPNSNAKNLRGCWAMSIKRSIWSVTPYVKSFELLVPRDFSNVNWRKKHIKNVEKCTFLAETLSKKYISLINGRNSNWIKKKFTHSFPCFARFYFVEKQEEKPQNTCLKSWINFLNWLWEEWSERNSCSR